LFAAIPNDVAENWTVTAPESDHVRFRITHTTQPSQADTSNSDTWIVSPHVSVLWPNGGETILAGTRDTILFSRILVTDLLRVELNRDYPNGTWEEIAANVNAEGSVQWNARVPESQHCRIRVTSQVTPSISDVSDGDFILRAPVMTLTSPDGGENIPIGVPFEILWSAPEYPDRVRLLLNRGYPDMPWETITSTTTNDGAYTWTPTGAASSTCRIKVGTLYDPQTYVESAADFSLTVLAAGEPQNLPTSFSVSEPYPNPFNPSTQIKLDLPALTHVEAHVFNRLGQQVSTLADETLDAGKHTLTFDGSHMPSGLYFVRISAYGETSLLKAVLLK
jgi:hypothetical protein